MFVKLGQLLSTRADLIPPELVRELGRLQDQVSPESRQSTEQVLDEDLGRPVGELFAHFDWEPVAAASIGQAYRAELPTGERVIVKVQRPGVAEAVARDLNVLAQLGHTLEAGAPWAREYRVSELVTEFADRLREELTSASRPATPRRSPPTWPPCPGSGCRGSTRSSAPRGSSSWNGWKG